MAGSDLKFKMTEFGTLEIVSTVSTDKGESEWSPSTQAKQEKASSPAKPNETNNQVSVIKKSQEGIN